MDASQVSGLFAGSGNSYHKNSLSDLVTGKVSSLTSSLIEAQNPDILTQSQYNAIENLVTYVTENVSSDAGKKLLADIAAVASLMSLGNANGVSGFDPLYAMLNGLSASEDGAALLDSMPEGTLVSGLL